MLTQPLMYKRIKQHPSVLTIYSNKLLKEGIITENDLKTACIICLYMYMNSIFLYNILEEFLYSSHNYLLLFNQ